MGSLLKSKEMGEPQYYHLSHQGNENQNYSEIFCNYKWAINKCWWGWKGKEAVDMVVGM